MTADAIRETLTAREIEVLTALVDGGGVAGVSERLGIARNTVKVHVHNASAKIGARSATHACAIIVAAGVIP